MGRLQGFWAEDGGERPRRSHAWRSRVDETISGLAVGHSGYAQPTASVLPALSAPSSRVPYTRRALRAAQRSSPSPVGGLPRCTPGTKAAACPRWNRWRRPRTRRAHFAARPVHVSGIAGFLVEVSERPRRGSVRRSRVDKTIRGLAVGHCGHEQPPASVVTALRTPPRLTTHTPFESEPFMDRCVCLLLQDL